MKQSSSALVILRAESSRVSLFRELQSLNDFEFLHADTLCYYKWAVRNNGHADERSTRVVIERGIEWSDIDRVLTESFQEYTNHYSTNRRLSAGVTLAAYQEWAAGLMKNPQNVTLIARDRKTNQVVGFILLMIDSLRSTAEVALNAVRPDSQRSGVYSILMTSAREYIARETDIRDLFISSQIGNTAVIEAWKKLGLAPYLSLNTLHLMRRIAFDDPDGR